MRLTRKLTLALVLGISAVMAGYAYLQVRQEVSFFESDIDQFERRGRVLLATLRSVWQTEGPQRTSGLVSEIATVLGDNVQVRWTGVDAPAGDLMRSILTPAELDQVTAGELVRVRRRTAEGELRRYVYFRLAETDPTVVEASESLQREVTFVRMSRLSILGATVLIALVCGLIATALGFQFVGKPIRLLRDQARRIGAGDLSQRLSVDQRDEIGELAEEMNRLCDRLAEAKEELAAETDTRIAMLEQLQHSDRLATIGQLASGVAHELGTPLTVVLARASMLGASDMSRTEVTDNARIIGEQASRMTTIIRQLLDFSRRRGPQLGVVDVQRIVTRTLELLLPSARKHRVTLEFTASSDPMLAEVDENQMQQALTNVIVNGIQAMPNGGRLSVRVSTGRAQPPAAHGGTEAEYLCVSVNDTGQGIAPENVPRLFEPFFTTKDVGEGTGLGLSVAYGIVAEHGGWIAVDSELGKGSHFRVFLPPVRNVKTPELEAAS